MARTQRLRSGCCSELVRRLNSLNWCGDCNEDRGVEAVFIPCPEPRRSPCGERF